MKEIRRNAFYPEGALWIKTMDDKYELAFHNKDKTNDDVHLDLIAEIQLARPDLMIQQSNLKHSNGRFNKKIQPSIIAGAVYYWDGSDFVQYTAGQTGLKQAELAAEAKPIDIEKLLQIAVSNAIFEQTVLDINARIPYDDIEAYLRGFGETGEARDNALLCWRYFREAGSEFIYPDSLTLKSIYNADFEFNEGAWMQAVYFNTDNYEMISAEEAYNDISLDNKRYRAFKKIDLDGEFTADTATQDEQSLPPIENGSTLYFPDDNIMKGAIEGGDGGAGLALGFFATPDRINNLGEFEEGALIKALMTEWFSFVSNNKWKAVLKPGSGDNWSIVPDELLFKDYYKVWTCTMYHAAKVLSMTDLPSIDVIKVDKSEAYYLDVSIEEKFGSACANCANYQANTCNKVNGEIAPEAICSYYEAKSTQLLNNIEGLAFGEGGSTLQQWGSNMEMMFLAMNMPEVYALKNQWIQSPAPDGNIYGSLLLLNSAVEKSIGTANEVALTATMTTRIAALFSNCLSKITEIILDAANTTGQKKQEYISKFAKDSDAERKTGVKRNSKRHRVKAAKTPSVIDMGTEDSITTPKRSAVARTEGKKVELPETKTYNGTRVEDYYLQTDGDARPLEVVLKGNDVSPEMTAIRNGENKVDVGVPLDGVKDALCGTTQRKSVAFIHGDRVRRAFNVFIDAVKFKDVEIAKVIFASMLIKDGAIILKGVAGTGKTTMIETLSMLMGNPVDYLASSDLHPDGMLNSGNTLDMLKDAANGTVGIAKHNPDKQPDDIYYYSRITNDEYQRSDYEKWLASTGKEMGVVARRNPYAVQFVDDRNEIPAISRETVFDPQVRPIVTHPIKFHNEGNRMNSKVADATLGLLAEKEIEFYGKTFPSPSSGPGAFTLLDYNPHKDWEPRGELDRALLDRFDCSVFVPALDIGNKVDLMGAGTSNTEPRAKAQAAINLFVEEAKTGKPFYNAIDPLSYYELCEVWADVNQVSLSRKQRFFAACYTNTFSMQFYKYPVGASRFYQNITKLPIDDKVLQDEAGDKLIGFGGEAGSATAEAKEAALMPFMDASLENFGFGDINEDTEDYFGSYQVKDTMQVNANLFAQIYNPDFNDPMLPGGTVARLNENFRPLGYRNTSSLVKLGKAYTWLEAVLAGDYDSGEEGLLVSKTTMLKLLPYIIGHRLNIGVGSGIKNNYINTEDWVKNDVIPEYIKKREQNWEEMYNGVYETMFGYVEAESREDGLADGATRPGKGNTGKITKEKFYNSYEKVMTRRGGGAAKLFYQSVMADPMAAGILDYAYKMAKDICNEPSVWLDDEKEFVYEGTQWAHYDSDGKARPIFKDE